MGSKSGLSLEANSSEKHLIKTDFKTDNFKQNHLDYQNCGFIKNEIFNFHKCCCWYRTQTRQGTVRFLNLISDLMRSITMGNLLQRIRESNKIKASFSKFEIRYYPIHE